MSSCHNPGFQTDKSQAEEGGASLKTFEGENERVVVGAEGQNPSERNSQASPLTDPIDDSKIIQEAEEAFDDDQDYSIFSILPFYGAIKRTIKEEKFQKWMKKLFISLLFLLYIAYFSYVMYIPTKAEEKNYWCEGDGIVLVITSVVFVGLLYSQIIKPLFGKLLNDKAIKPTLNIFGKVWKYRITRIALYGGLPVGVSVFLAFDAREEPRRLISLLGVFILLLFGFVCSTAPRKVRWRSVTWGMGLQFVLGVMVLRWPLGRAVFECAGDRVGKFLAFTDKGSSFVFGDLVETQYIFAFKVLSVVIFFSFCIQILYYWGVMQWVVIKLGWFLQVTVGTTACESVNTAANIFLGMTVAPLVIKPYIPDMTKSELHAVMTGGFATVAGTTLSAYIYFGVDSTHLLCASIMSAPAALAFAKLFYPETKKSKTSVSYIKIVKGEETNWLHAAMVGVGTALPLVANIAANLIAFYAFISLCSSVIDWFCTLAGANEGACSLKNLFSWFFMPLAWVMGVEWSECDKVGELVGIKTILNELVAYARLSEMKSNDELSKRAEIIATYALCGYSNIGSIGITLGALGAMAPTRKADLAKVVLRAMIAGNCACFLTACIAGALLTDGNHSTQDLLSANMTLSESIS